MQTSETQAAAELVEKECPCLGLCLLVQAAKHPSAFAFAKIRDVFLEWLNMCPEAGAPFFDLMWGTSQSPVGMAGTGSPWRLFPVSRIELCVSRRFATQLMTYSPEFHSITYKYTNTLAVNTPRTTIFFFFWVYKTHLPKNNGSGTTWQRVLGPWLSPYVCVPTQWCPLCPGKDGHEARKTYTSQTILDILTLKKPLELAKTSESFKLHPL